MPRQSTASMADNLRRSPYNARPAGKPPTAVSGPVSAAAPLPNGATRLTAHERHQMIVALAEHMSRERGYVPGRELDDWLAAEKTIDGLFV